MPCKYLLQLVSISLKMRLKYKFSVYTHAGVVVSHAGQLILRVCEHNAWTPAFLSSL